jgi:hypothetical protein
MAWEREECAFIVVADVILKHTNYYREMICVRAARLRIHRGGRCDPAAQATYFIIETRQ